MRPGSALISVLAGLVAACAASAPPRLGYAPPSTPPTQPALGYVGRPSADLIWNQLLDRLSQSGLRIDLADRERGVMVASYSGEAAPYVTCGSILRFGEGGPERIDASGAASFELLKVAKLPPARLDAIAGTYELEPGHNVLIARSQGGLIYVDQDRGRVGALFALDDRTLVGGPSLGSGYPIELRIEIPGAIGEPVERIRWSWRGRNATLGVRRHPYRAEPVAFDSGYQMQRTEAVGWYVASGNLRNTQMGSAQTGGSSGGPWLANFGTVPIVSAGASLGSATVQAVVGVTSYGSTTVGFNRQGASFFGQNVQFPLGAYGVYGAGNIGRLVQATCTSFAAYC